VKDKESKTPQFYMRPRNYNQYNYVYFFMMLFITVFIVCDITAFRMGSVIFIVVAVIKMVVNLSDLILTLVTA